MKKNPSDGPLVAHIKDLQRQRAEALIVLQSIERQLDEAQHEHAKLCKGESGRSVRPIDMILEIVDAPIWEADIVAKLDTFPPQSIHQAIEFHTRPPAQRKQKDGESPLVCVRQSGDTYVEAEFIYKGRSKEVPPNLICSRSWFEKHAS